MRIAKLFAACLAAVSLLISCTQKAPELQGSWELDTIDGQTQLHFQLWKGNKPQDPEAWLK